jgi:hypothetical protein
VKLTLSVDEEVFQKAHKHAERLGTSVDQLVREYLEHLAGKPDPEADVAEFKRLSAIAKGNSGEWKFDRDELHDRAGLR